MGACDDMMDGGVKPEVVDDLADKEREKYQKVWALPDYSNYSPGEHAVSAFLKIANPWDGHRIIDFGCGDGKACVKLADLGFHVTGVDHVDVRKRNGKKKYKFVQHNLWTNFKDENAGLRADYGYCCDVMEHIPEERVGLALLNIFKRCRHVFLSISFVEDHFGAEVGESLHLTVKPYEWWKEQLEKFGTVVDGRDMMHGGFFWVRSGGAQFLTVTMNEAVSNLEHNLKLGLPQFHGHAPQDRKTLLLAGGPSLNDFTEEIQQKRKDGAYLITVNGTHDWALDHDMTPSVMLIGDNREFNARFLERTQKECLYLISSCAHPKIFEKLGHTIEPKHDAVKRNVKLWHPNPYPDVMHPMLLEHYFGFNFCIAAGGSTVVIRSLSLLQIMGLRDIEVYGLDSCHGSVHAYEQPENSGEEVTPLIVAGKTFMCSTWQAQQAQHFVDMVKNGMLDKIKLTVHGDGLIAWIIEAGSKAENIDFYTTEGAG